MRTEPQYELVLTSRTPIARGVVLLTMVHPHGRPLPPWTPGAHLDLILRPDLIRQYSLCGDPQDRYEYQIAVLCEPEGRGGSRHIHENLARGDTVTVRGPRNNFSLVPADRYLFIAGGIGITPILPMLSQVSALRADWLLVYGGRTRASMAFRNRLTGRYGERVQIMPQDETGLLDLKSLLLEPREGTAIYCCGPGALIIAVEEHCSGWPPGTLHVERFTPKQDAGSHTAFEIVLARSGHRLTVPPDRSILSVVEEAGIAALSSCREGTCGTCETAVLDGVPDHRDSLLTESERAAGDTMMICVSRARSPHLVLDL